MTNILLVFIKNPRLGAVKTRLAATVGDPEALRIYGMLLEKTRAAALAARAERWLFYSESIPERDEWPQDDFVKFVQSGEDLGARMETAFEQAFAAGADKVVIIGADCPELTGALLDAAFARLDTVEFVIGPCPDGGYYLLGMRYFEPALFRNIPWSTETVFADTRAIIKNSGRRFFLLPTLADIDTAADWQRYLERGV